MSKTYLESMCNRIFCFQEKPNFLPFRNSRTEEDLSLSSGEMLEADAKLNSILRKYESANPGNQQT